MIYTKRLLIVFLAILFHASAFSATQFPDNYINELIKQFETKQIISTTDLKPGHFKKVRYGQFTVYIYKRTSYDIDYLNKYSDSKIFDDDDRRWQEATRLYNRTTLSSIPNYLIRESQKKFTGLPFRSLKNDIFVVIATSPRHGCHVKYLHPDLRNTKYDIFMNVCHGQRYDSAGREITINGTPAVKGYNLFIPPYTYNQDNHIVLGGFSVDRKIAHSPINYQGLTPQKKLWMACHNNDYSAALEALQNGANPNLKEENGNALDYAITGSDIRLINLLLQNGAHPTDISREMANIVDRKEVLSLLDSLDK